jgi:hypothetical protein
MARSGHINHTQSSGQISRVIFDWTLPGVKQLPLPSAYSFPLPFLGKVAGSDEARSPTFGLLSHTPTEIGRGPYSSAMLLPLGK